MNKNKKIAIIGLGYVGLPLAVEFGKKQTTIGFDINTQRIAELNSGIDKTMETTQKELESATKLTCTTDTDALKECDIYIITVPTPIDKHRRPDLTPLYRSSETVGQVLSKGNIVIYESTVFPGCTEEECVPVLERVSGLTFNEDFYCGYSPERINPGDKEHTVTKILKVTSGSTPEIADAVDALYQSIITAGTHKASCIKVAEAAKVIENSQRDLNIAFVNELAKIFNLVGIDTIDVLEAAGTKWNFLPFRPGLVGGHCIGVDPYYLTYKAEELGYQPEIILAGRRLNDGMGGYVASEVVKLMIQKGHRILNANVLVLGITFKENCPDIRNSRAIDVVRELQSFGCNVDVCDPWADPKEVKADYDIDLTECPYFSCAAAMEPPQTPGSTPHAYDSVILAVAHDDFKSMDIKKLSNGNETVIYDIKNCLPRDIVDGRL